MKYKYNRKKGFTFAELMVSLVIISVITALLYPTISDLAPNNNKQLFKSAYKTVELTIQDIVATNEDTSSPKKLCEAFKKRLNTVAISTGGSYSEGCAAAGNQLLQTSNGMRWYFASFASDIHTIYIDVNASNNGDSYNSVANSGDPSDPTTVWTKGCFRNNDNVARDTFLIKIHTNGKVSANDDTVAGSHLRDDTD